jgi:hypothetical protein
VKIVQAPAQAVPQTFAKGSQHTVVHDVLEDALAHQRALDCDQGRLGRQAFMHLATQIEVVISGGLAGHQENLKRLGFPDTAG